MEPIHHHAETYFQEAHRLVRDEVDPAFVIALHHNETGLLHPLPTETVEGHDAYARLEQARWCVDCPFCPSAQHANASDHRFFCAFCRNQAVEHQYVRLVWPSEVNVAKIEAVVGLRPDPLTRNWGHRRRLLDGKRDKFTSETLTQLKAENKEHGLPTG